MPRLSIELRPYSLIRSQNSRAPFLFFFPRPFATVLSSLSAAPIAITPSDHLRPLQPCERTPFVLHLHFLSRISLVTLSSFSLPPSLPPPSSVAATTLLRPLSRRHLRWCFTFVGAAPPFRAQPFRARLSCTSFSIFPATVIPPFLQRKFLTHFCFVFYFVYINFQYRLLQVLIFIGIEIVWIVCIYYELALVSHLRFNTKIMYCP